LMQYSLRRQAPYCILHDTAVQTVPGGIQREI